MGAALVLTHLRAIGMKALEAQPGSRTIVPVLLSEQSEYIRKKTFSSLPYLSYTEGVTKK